MGLEAIYPKLRLSAANTERKIYPYFLMGVHITLLIRFDQAIPDELYDETIELILKILNIEVDCVLFQFKFCQKCDVSLLTKNLYFK